MINRDSKSYPYLAIAQHYGIPYWKVLQYSDNPINPFYSWQLAVWEVKNKLK